MASSGRGWQNGSISPKNRSISPVLLPPPPTPQPCPRRPVLPRKIGSIQRDYPHRPPLLMALGGGRWTLAICRRYRLPHCRAAARVVALRATGAARHWRAGYSPVPARLQVSEPAQYARCDVRRHCQARSSRGCHSISLALHSWRCCFAATINRFRFLFEPSPPAINTLS